MKLKIKNFNWLAGRPVIVLNNETAKKLNVHVDDRVLISSRKKIYAVVDIFQKVIGNNEIGLSHEISSILKLKDKSYADVYPAELSLAGRLIKKKISGISLTKSEINTIISEVVHNNLTEAEIAYFVSAEKLRGMSKKEIIDLTESMVKNGNKLNFGKKIVADKHCLPFETEILVRESNKLLFLNIGDLVEKNIDNKNSDIEVLSWDDNYKVCFVPIKSFFKVKSPKQMHKITLRGNRNITLTEDHTLFILRQGKVVNLASKEIKGGDYVLVPRGISEKSKVKEIELFFNNSLKKNGKIKRELRLTKELMRFIGYYLSEGFRNYQGLFLNFGAHEKDLIEDSKKCIKEVFGIEPTITKPHKTATRVCIYSQELSKAFLALNLGDGASDKRIPEFIFNLDEELQLEFLRSLFDGDGYIRRGYEAVYVTVSKELANQLSYLLSLLGISASISIQRANIRNFPKGNYACSESYYIYTQAREIYGGRKRNNVSFLNLLPIKEIGKIRKEKIGWIKRRALKNQKYITFEKLNEIREFVEEEAVKTIINSDIGVLEVKSNEGVNSSSDFVYDLKTSNGRFIAGFMPICIHNCIGGIAGNRTTPIVVSICASAGLIMPKTSSRAITSASGTADVIETISKVEFFPKELKKIVEKTGACLAWGGSLGLAPSDDKIIQVERLLNLDVESQLIASIISKKIAAGSNHILIDIPFGSSAKAETKKDAENLAKHFRKIAEHFNLKIITVLTDGKQPIGDGIGPVLEMLDILSVLQQKPLRPLDLESKSLFLASELMKLCGINDSYKKAMEILVSGKAYEKFKDWQEKDYQLKIILNKMEYIYGALLLHKLGKEVSEENLHKIVAASGNPVDESKVKVLVASLKGVNIDEQLANAALASSASHAVEAPKEEKKKEEPKAEAAEGLASLFG